MEYADQILAFLILGDKRGLELLFRQFYRPLVMYVYKLVHSQAEDEDDRYRDINEPAGVGGVFSPAPDSFFPA